MHLSATRAGIVTTLGELSAEVLDSQSPAAHVVPRVLEPEGSVVGEADRAEVTSISV